MFKKLFFFLAFVFLISVGSFLWYDQNNDVAKGEVDIFEGASVKDIAGILKRSGIISNEHLFYYYIKANDYYYNQYKKEQTPYLVSFKHGTYSIEGGSFDDLIQQLNEGTGKGAPIVRVTIPEGTHVEQMSTLFEKSGLFDRKTFLSLLNDPAFYAELQQDYSWLPKPNLKVRYLLEGYLHPNTYDFDLHSDPKTVIRKMISYTDEFYQTYKKHNHNLSFSDIVILASVVERESKFSKDRPKVAQVFLNRLQLGMKLESDITAAYANNEHKVFMTYQDIDTNSPYNTYKIKGLPVGPICSPSKEAIEAVLTPAGKTFEHLYFYARPSGETFYAKTWNQHEKNRIKWEHEWIELTKQ